MFKGFFWGVVTGFAAAIAVRKYGHLLLEEPPEHLLDRLSDDIKVLEERTQSVSEKVASLG